MAGTQRSSDFALLLFDCFRPYVLGRFLSFVNPLWELWAVRPLRSRGAPAEPLDLSLGEREEPDRETETPGPRAQGPKGRSRASRFVLSSLR